MKTTTINMQRIEKAFFKAHNPPPKKKFKKPAKKIKLITIFILALLVLIPTALYFSANFNVTILIFQKKQINLPKGAVSLLGENLTEVSINNSIPPKISNNSSIQFKASNITPAQITLNFKTPLNAARKNLVLITNKIGKAELKVVFRDNKYISTSLTPLKVQIDDTNNKLNYTRISIPIPENIVDIDWAKITQIRMFFVPLENIEKLFVIQNIYTANKPKPAGAA